MTDFSVACPAKVNLFLRILAREDSGYHQIETLFQAVGLYDRVDAHPGGDGIAFEARPGESEPGLGDITAELGDPGDNTVVKAAQEFYDVTGIEPGVRLVLTKAIPAGTGLGGASSGCRRDPRRVECVARPSTPASPDHQTGRLDRLRRALLLHRHVHRAGVGQGRPAARSPAAPRRTRCPGRHPRAHRDGLRLPRSVREAEAAPSSTMAGRHRDGRTGRDSPPCSKTTSSWSRSNGRRRSVQCGMPSLRPVPKWPA